MKIELEGNRLSGFRRPWIAIAAALVATSLSAQPSPDFRLEEATIGDVHRALESGALTCRALVGHYLDRIEAYDKDGPELNTVQTLNPRALDEAAALDASFQASGLSGPLHCVPVLLKDQVETSDMETSYGSELFQDFIPQRDATIVLKMKQAGAIILAKTTMGEFASRYVGSAFGIIRNAYDPTRNPSGSSGGTASGIAANFGLVGIGEDTGGSIRGPAAVTSLVGLRPTVPLVSRFGMMPATPATDTLGPMTRTVTDAAILLGVIAGYDENDALTSYAVGRVPDSYSSELTTDGLAGARIGVLRAPMDDKTDPTSEDYRKVRVVIDAAIAALEEAGAVLVDPVVLDKAEASFEALQSGDFGTENETDAYLAQHPNAPYKSFSEILLTGKVTPWRASGLIKAVGKPLEHPHYLPVLLARDALRLSVMKVMAEHELEALVYATFDHQTTPIAHDALTNADTEDRYGLGSNRALSPATGLPALTLPAGFTSDGLPVGLELLGRAFTEATLLKLGYAFEQATHHRRPPATTPPLASEPR